MICINEADEGQRVEVYNANEARRVVGAGPEEPFALRRDRVTKTFTRTIAWPTSRQPFRCPAHFNVRYLY